MKNIVLSFLILISAVYSVHAGRGSGGAAFGGALGLIAACDYVIAGSMIGGIATTAIVSGSSSRHADDAARARQETELLRREQERDRVQRLENQVREEKLRRTIGGGDGMLNLLIGIIVVLILGIMGLIFLVLKRH